MTNMQLLQEGLTLMWVGISFVMLFLFVLILALRLMSYSVNRFFPEELPEPAVKPHAIPATQSDQIAQLRPVIVAAIAHHRRQKTTK